MKKELRRELEHKYLRACYEYYILGCSTMPDSSFDNLFDKLKEIDSVVVDYVDFPSSEQLKSDGFDLSLILDKDKKDEKKYPHIRPMLSLEKIQIVDEEDIPVNSLNNFFERKSLKNGEKVSASSKYDGNSMEVTYENGVLVKALTRGNKIAGFDKTNKMKHIVPNKISIKDKIVQVRGEVVINVELWERKYNNPVPGKVCNARNYIGGLLNRDEYNKKEIEELSFVAYDFVLYDDNDTQEYSDDTLSKLEELGFNENYKPFELMFEPNIDNFIDMYFKMKNYRDNICPFLIDGIVIKYPEQYRIKLGETVKYPKHSIAIKFPTLEVESVIKDIHWKMGKTGELSPVAQLEPVELLGTIVKKCSLHNLGIIVKYGAFPGSTITLKKSGEIIPMMTNVIVQSPEHNEYIKYFEENYK